MLYIVGYVVREEKCSYALTAIRRQGEIKFLSLDKNSHKSAGNSKDLGLSWKRKGKRIGGEAYVASVATPQFGEQVAQLPFKQSGAGYSHATLFAALPFLLLFPQPCNPFYTYKTLGKEKHLLRSCNFFSLIFDKN